jgi:hypothetical protein
MSRSRIGRRMALSTPLLASIALALPAGSPAASKPTPTPAPQVSTTAALHVLETSALLTAAINPEGQETSYYFQYGPTKAYGLQTPTVNLGSGMAKIKVGKPIAKLQAGELYHYRVVAVTSTGVVVPGHDRSFTTKKVPLKLALEKIAQVPYGTPFILRGTLAGLGNASHQIALQASPFPYLEAFTEIGAPGITNATGRFAFRVAHLVSSTQFRVITLDARPVYSQVITVHAAVKVTLHVHSSAQPGLVRLYGTVTPAEVGARVDFQVHMAVRPRTQSSESESTTRFVRKFGTTTKKGGRTFSRFSLVVKVRVGGRYRAFVKVDRAGGLVSGYSTTVVVHAPPKRKG